MEINMKILECVVLLSLFRDDSYTPYNPPYFPIGLYIKPGNKKS